MGCGGIANRAAALPTSSASSFYGEVGGLPPRPPTCPGWNSLKGIIAVADGFPCDIFDHSVVCVCVCVRARARVCECVQHKSVAELLHELHGLLCVQETCLQAIKYLRTAQTILYNNVSCQLTYPLGDQCTSLWLFQNTKAAAQWPINFPLYSVTMQNPSGWEVTGDVVVLL